ncbi:MAG: hypothetical protein E3K37_01380 [Candidatus Kuenenia sp.]|nr:hypothetical protein [Candidatus Kuenenia hertensis]
MVNCCLTKIEIQENLKSLADDLEIIRDLKPHDADEKLTRIVGTLRDITSFIGGKR